MHVSATSCDEVFFVMVPIKQNHETSQHGQNPVRNPHCIMAARQHALRCYKKLLKTRLEVFKDDDFALRQSHAEIRRAFEKNRDLTDPEQIKKSIEIAEQAEEILRKEVMQARFVTDDRVRLNVRLDNVKDVKTKTFNFIDDD